MRKRFIGRGVLAHLAAVYPISPLDRNSPASTNRPASRGAGVSDRFLSAAFINAPRSSPSFARTVTVGPVFHALKYDSGLMLGVGAGVARSTGVAVGDGDGLGEGDGLGVGVGVAVAVGLGDGGGRLSLRLRFLPHSNKNRARMITKVSFIYKSGS